MFLLQSVVKCLVETWRKCGITQIYIKGRNNLIGFSDNYRWLFFSFMRIFVCFFVCFNFNWRLITLRYCGGFCHTSTWINHGCTCVPHPDPPSASHPSGSSQCTSPEHPVSCIKPGLAICFTYGNIHVSALFSQIIPPSPPPTESNSLFFTSVSLSLSRI